MDEKLINRIGRLVSATFEQMLEDMEDRNTVALIQATIDEVDEAIADLRHLLGKAQADKHNATRRLISENERHDDLAQKARVALDNGREDLAETAIALQLDIEAQIPVLEAAIADAGQREQELDNSLKALQARRRDMVAEQDRIAAEATASPSPSPSAINDYEAQAGQAIDTFEQAVSRHTGLPRGAQTDEKALAELEELQRQHRIQERLESLRKEDRP